jgi:ABC-type multidrug transport system fused ATPase/permease subunit
MVLESAVSLAIPFFIGQFSSSVLQEPTAHSFFNIHYGYIIGFWLVLIVLQTLTRYHVSFRVNMIGASILANLSCRLYDHVQMLPVDYFSKRKKGEILSLISNDANVIAHFLSGIITSLVPSILIAVGAVVLMASINIQLALIITLSVPGFFFLLKILGRKIKPISEAVTQQQAGIVSIAAENFSTIKLVKSFSREEIESEKFKENTQQMLTLRRAQFKIQALISPLIQMLISIGIVIVVLVSALHYRSGELSISELITLLMYGLLFAKPISSLAGMYGQWQQALGSSQRIIDVFAVAPEANDTGKEELNCTKGEVELCNVSFSYQDNSENKTLLKNINMRFKAGQVNVIFGENGAGKTTLLHLLMRFISPQEGNIYIDGQDIIDCRLRSLRKHIGLVSQDVALSHGSVIENITYGQPEASLEAIMAAAQKAGAHEFIEKLPNGYYTQVGDNGVLLSGGQRQRISLARTLLMNCKIIIFDEPTSFADSHGKSEFANLLSSTLREHTVIVVTHDAELRDIASNVLHLEAGELVIQK